MAIYRFKLTGTDFKKVPGYRKYYKRQMNKLYRRLWKQKGIALFKHPYSGW